MDFKEIEKEARNKIWTARNNVNQCREQLAHLAKVRYKKNYFQQHKDIFVKADRNHDQEAFEHDLKTYEMKKQKSLDRLQKDQAKREQHTFQPQINERTLELTKHQLPFAEKVNKHLRQAKSTNDLRKKQKKEQERRDLKDRTKDPHLRNRMKTTISFEGKVKQEERVERSRKFFLENLQWKKQIEEETFAKQVLQIYANQGLDQFKQVDRSKRSDQLNATNRTMNNGRVPPRGNQLRSFTPTMKTTVGYTNASRL
jgi:hypothetical protein